MSRLTYDDITNAMYWCGWSLGLISIALVIVGVAMLRLKKHHHIRKAIAPR